MNTMTAMTAGAVFGGLANLPGYQVYEYQLVLALPDTVKEKLRKLRLNFAEQFGLPVYGRGTVLLPLVKYRQRGLLEERMRIALQQLVSGWKPVQVNLQDYASQPTHSIFIPVTSQQHLQPLVKELKSIQHLLRPDKEHQPFFVTEHKFLLAGKLPAALYEKAWAACAGRHFTAQFRADACLLLKRKQGDLHWQILQRIEWRNLPIGIRQTSLFE